MTAADLNHIEARRRGAHAAIRRPDFDGEIALRWMDAEPRRIACGERDTDAPVSTMKLIRRPSTRASTRKCRARRAARLSRASPQPRSRRARPAAPPMLLARARPRVVWGEDA
jgi:hypothetical protein